MRPGFGQTTVIHLEPSRAATTVGCIFLTMLTAGVAAVALAYRTEVWPAEWRPTDFVITDRAVLIVAAVAALLAAVALVGAVVNGRRWHTARTVERLSEEPLLAGIFPDTRVSPATQPSPVIPLLDITFVRRFRRPRVKFRCVTREANVIGRRPLHIAYLRVFENQPRMRTFIEGAWREFGYVHFLRSAAAVTPAELKAARRSGDVAGLFVASRGRLAAEIDSGAGEPNPRGRYRFTRIGATTIKVRDRYGSYPVRPVLCHGSFWKDGVDALLERVDLVALDLSGYTDKHAGTRYEVQRVVDRFPIERVVFLADQRSNRKFLDRELRQSWQQMAPGSPNAVHQSKTALVAVTDYYRSSQTQQQGQTTQVQVRLVARRQQTRRLLTMVQLRLDG